jgi:hypothetical protein
MCDAFTSVCEVKASHVVSAAYRSAAPLLAWVGTAAFTGWVKASQIRDVRENRRRDPSTPSMRQFLSPPTRRDPRQSVASRHHP